MSAHRSLITAAGLLLVGNLASRVLGLVRDQVIAGLFGETAVTSAFVTASTVPTIFYDLVIGGAVSAALVPVLSGYGDRDDRGELGAVVGTLLVGAALVLGVLVGVLILAAVPVTVLLGVSPDKPIWSTTVAYVRIVVPALLFLGLSGVAAAVCYSRHRVVYPAFSVALFNAGLVATAVILHARLGAASLALGVLVGAFLQLAAVVPGLRGIDIRLGFHPGHPAVRQILRLYAPVAAGLVISEIGVLVDRNLAWQTGEASVATMRYATTLVQLPLGLVATATSLAALPVLSRLVDDPDRFRSTLASGMRLALLAIVPATAFLVVFAVPAFRLIYQRGAFDATATAATATAFMYYAPQLPFVAVDQLLVYAFYARRNTVTPMLVGLGGVGIYLASALLLIGPFHAGLAGLILANTFQNSLHAVVLFALLSRAAGSLAAHRVGQTLLRAILAGIFAGLLGVALERAVPLPSGIAGLVTYVAVAGVLVFAGYLVVLHVLGVEEIVGLLRAIQGRLRTRVSS